MSYLYLLCFLAFIRAVLCLQLEVFPNTIVTGKTESLILNCNFTSPDLFRMRQLYTLSLSHSSDSVSDTEVLATTSLNDDQVHCQSKDCVASGAIGTQSDSYLRYQLYFPYYHQTGNYMCEAYGIGFNWRPLTLTAQANVSGNELSLKFLSEELRILRLENIHFAKVLEKYTENNAESERIQLDLFNSSLSFAEQLDRFKATLTKIVDQSDCVNKSRKDRQTTLVFNFHESEPFEGRRYYLLKNMDKFTLTSAQSTCEWYGGYLAEIDNDLELDFVRNFVRNYTFTFTWISGSDEGEENLWINLRNNMTLKYFKWGIQDPVSSDFNCLILDKDVDWFMNVAKCSSSYKYASYICEISD